MRPVLIFVYGTLKRGFANHEVLGSQALYLGEAVTVDRFPLVIMRWASPAMLHAPGEGHRVVGEAYAVSGDTVARLDTFESNYWRGGLEIILRGKVVSATTYFRIPGPELRQARQIREFTQEDNVAYIANKLQGRIN